MKILGIVLLLCSGAGTAFFLINRARLTLMRVQAWLELVRFIRSSVDNYSMSVSEILRSCPAELIVRLGYPSDADAPERLEEIAELSDIPDDEVGEIIKDLFGNFGKSYRTEQVTRCDECIDKLRAKEAYLAERLPVKKKIILCVSLCATAGVIILLL